MSRDEIKSEISKVLDHLSDEALRDLLDFLKNLEATAPGSIIDSKNLERILAEDNDLLQKLAQ